MIKNLDITSIGIGEYTTAINSPLISQTAKATEYIKGFKTGALKQELNGILEFIAPSVKVSYASQYAYSYKVVNGKDDLPLNNYDAFVRGEGGEFGYTGSNDSLAVGQLTNHGLATVIEKRDVEEDPGFVQEKFNRLVNLVTGAKILKAVDALESVATNSHTIDVTKNPIVQIEQALKTTAETAGFFPNRILIGRGFWIKLHGLLIGGNNAWNFSAPKSVEELGDMLGVEILCPKAHYKSGSSLPLIAGDEMIAFVGESGISTEDLSHVKTFNGGELDFFEAEHPQGKLKILTVNEYTDIKVTSTIGASKFAFSA